MTAIDTTSFPCQMLQLQRLFAHLELCDLAAIDTGGLTRSFGWTSADVFEQQDVQELFKVLLDRLEEALDEGAAAPRAELPAARSLWKCAPGWLPGGREHGLGNACE